MNVFEKVQEAIRPQAQDDHARRNKENEVSLKKANEEIPKMLGQDNSDHMRDDMETSFKNDTHDIVNEVLLVIDLCASRYQVDKKELLAVLIEELEMRL